MIVTARQASSCVEFMEKMRSRLITAMATETVVVVSPRGHELTADEVAEIVTLAKADLTIEAIAAKVCRSEGAVWNVLKEHGVEIVRQRARPKQRRERGKAMLRKGASVPEVARRLGVSRGAARLWRLEVESEAIA